MSLQATPGSVKSGSSATLTWTSSNAVICGATGAWSGIKKVSGSLTTGPITATSTFTLTCAGYGGEVAQSATISVATTAAPLPPSVTLSANPSTIASGTASALSWSSTNASSCIIASGGQSGAVATTGSGSTPTLTATTVYTLSCTGTGGSASRSTTVSVTPAATGPVTGTATVSWAAPSANTNGTALTPLTGYTLYYGTTQNSLTHSVTVSGASTTECEISGLAAGTWYFAVAADASDGTQSALSNIGSKAI
jgi:hypothetical protein